MVKKVTSFSHYRDLLKGKLLINNVFTPLQTQKYIKKQRLFSDITDDIVWFIYDEETYYQLVLVKAKDSQYAFSESLKIFIGNKPTVTFIVEEKQSYTELKNFLQNSGLQYRCLSNEYNLTDFDNEKCNSNNDIVMTKINDEGDYYKIIQLWENCLPLIEVPKMSVDDLKEIEEKNQLFFIKNENDEVIAAAYHDMFMGTSTIHHICVSSNCRGQGLAGILLKEWIKKLRELNAKKARSWIEEKNISSQKSFMKLGFEKTNAVSHQYVLNFKD